MFSSFPFSRCYVELGLTCYYKNGFVLNIFRSERDMRCNNGKTFIIMIGEISGKYRRPSKNASSNRVTGTKKCKCPLKLRGTTLKRVG